MNEREAASIVAIIAAAYPQWPASRETVAVYADALSDLGHQETLATVKEIILTDDRWPTIAQIRRRHASRAGALAPTPAQAWGEISHQSGTTGRTGSPAWSHPAIGEAVKTVGWWNICNSSNSETLRSQFLKIYEDNQKRSDIQVILSEGGLALNAGSRDSSGNPRPLALIESQATGNRD